MTVQRGEHCSDASRAAGEPLAGTATTTERWLLVEMPGTWPRDVAATGSLPEDAHESVAAWLARTPNSRVLFLRRPGRSVGKPLVFAVRSQESAAETRWIDVERHEDLAHVDPDADGELVATQLVLVCGHGTRDACCALRGTAVFGALANSLGDEELWISSHQGGHRFAGNVLVLPAGMQLGRVDSEDARVVVARALAGRVELAHYRGRTCYEPPVQAAEHAVRKHAGLDGFDDLRLLGVDGPVVRFLARDGSPYAAFVEATVGPVVPASCGAAPEPQRVFSARVVSGA